MPFNPSKEKEIVRYSGYLSKSQADKLEKYVKKTGISKAKVLGKLLDFLEDKELTSNIKEEYVTLKQFNEEIIQLKSFIEGELSKVNNSYVKEVEEVKKEIDKRLSEVNNSYAEEGEELNSIEDELLNDNTEKEEEVNKSNTEKLCDRPIEEDEELSEVNNGYVEEEDKIRPPEEFLRLPLGEVRVKELTEALKCDRNVLAQIAKGKRSKLPFEDFWKYLEVKESMKGERASYSWTKIK